MLKHIKMRRVRDPHRISPPRWLPGLYVAHYRPPGAPGFLPFARIERRDFPFVEWSWYIDDPHQLLPIELDVVTLRGEASHKRDAEAAVDAIAGQVTEFWERVHAYLHPEDHGGWELDEWVPRADLDNLPALTVDAARLTRVLDALDELLDLFLLDGTPGTLEEKVRLFAKVRDLHKREGRLDALTHDLKIDLREELTVAEVDGRIWKAKRVNKRTGYDKDALRDAVNRAALRAVPDFDEETGEVLGTHEPTPAEAVDTVWKAADVATGRTKVLREQFGVDLDEYAQSNWSTEIVEVAEADLKPEELAELRGEEP